MRDDFILTFDIEEARHMAIGGGGAMPDSSELGSNLERLLDILKDAGAKATFFIVAELAGDYREIIKRIAKEGHEIGLHSMRHKLVYQMSAVEFEKDTKEGREILENVCGTRVVGYRAPAWSVDIRRTPWFWEILKKLGFKYSSSLMPFKTHLYGDAAAPRFRHEVNTKFGKIWEIPVPVAGFFYKVPFSGGFYFRMWPSFFRHRLERAFFKECGYLIYYFHLRDLGLEKAPIRLSIGAYLINYFGAKRGMKKFSSVLKNAGESRLSSLIDAKQDC